MIQEVYDRWGLGRMTITVSHVDLFDLVAFFGGSY